jgi:2-C-methyl-D-erythritol 4-phosphate cytidylyltransferase
MKPFVSAVITAAGLGLRFNNDGSNLPKQFRPLGGVPVLSRTVAAFSEMACIDEIVVTLPQCYLFDLPFNKISALTTGGANRQASVYEALQRVSKNADIVLIHDGVRPFVTEGLVEEIIRCVEQGYAALAAVRPTDTVKQADGEGIVVSTPDRDNLWLAQTPQGFNYSVIMQAHGLALREGFVGTDDCMLAERYGLARVKIVEGLRENLKITTPSDMRMAEMILNTKFT